MPAPTIKIIELSRSRESRVTDDGKGDSLELAYAVTGTYDDAVVRGLVESTSPPTYLGLVRKEIDCRPTGAGNWEATVRYQADIRDSQYTFDTTGGTQHITQSRETLGKYAPAGKTAPDCKGAIGVTPDSVDGVDIVVPTYSFSETHYLAEALVTPAYKAILFLLTGKVNNAPWLGFQRGEVLFLGASGSNRGDGFWEITFRFAASPNMQNLQVGGITIANKPGWAYVWFRYQDTADVNQLIKRPVAAYVERLYDEGDFTKIGIGP
jgi:hypothetical protein